MTDRIIILLVLTSLAGCGSSQPPATSAPQAEASPGVSPAQLRTVLEGLDSDNPKVQYAALETLSRLPAAAGAYREHVERVGRDAKDERVRRKATELLRSLGSR